MRGQDDIHVKWCVSDNFNTDPKISRKKSKNSFQTNWLRKNKYYQNNNR